MTVSTELQLFASLALAGALCVVLLAMWGRRAVAEKRHRSLLRDREERLKLALWASSEQYWDYDLKGRHMDRMWVESRSNAPELRVVTVSESDHRIHPDDVDLVRELMRDHLQGHA